MILIFRFVQTQLIYSHIILIYLQFQFKIKIQVLVYFFYCLNCNDAEVVNFKIHKLFMLNIFNLKKKI